MNRMSLFLLLAATSHTLADTVTFRRNIARWDNTIANEPYEPNATFCNYGCEGYAWENNVSIDYGVPETAMRFGGDFYTPTISDKGSSGARIFGNIVVNHDPRTLNRCKATT